MPEFDRKSHWENIYQTRPLEEVSWYQPKPETSLEIIEDLGIKKDAKIIDIGGGDSLLVDHLLLLGYSNISVLDISEKAIDRAKERLGEKADLVTWITADASNFQTAEVYDLWHDRAAFHFLTEESEIEKYIKTASSAVKESGKTIIGTFSNNGPKKCSGIEIKQYSSENLTKSFQASFEKVKCKYVDHTTPSGGVQNFVFCAFNKISR